MFKKIFIISFIVIAFFLCKVFFINKKPSYILSEGKKDEARLDLQNELFKKHVIEAFNTAETIKNLTGLTVLDFGSGSSSAYPIIMKFIGDSGKYIGIDSSEEQINTSSKKKLKNASYIHGDEETPEVIYNISLADIVYIRFVIMHQKEQEEFVKKIYSYLKPGAILIIQEPEGTVERKQEMLKQYPDSEILCDFKSKLGKALGLDYDFAGKLEAVLNNIEPKSIIHKANSIHITALQAKEIHKKNIESVSEKACRKGIYTKDYIDQYLEAVSKLPSDDNKYWTLDLLHTFIVQK